MRLANGMVEGRNRTGLVDGDSFVPLSDYVEIVDLFQEFGTDFVKMERRLATSISAPIELDRVELAPPVARPGKIIGIGRNYGEHAREGGLRIQDKPRMFFKPSSAISGPFALVKCPESVQMLDFEGELVAMIGRHCRNENASSAASAIGGYMVGNDLSAREFQFAVSPPQTSFAKGMDGFAAIGPWLVTADELGVAPDLQIETRLNGKTVQSDRTGNLIFPISKCIAHVSQYMTLEPGDLIYTGTPAGVGYFREPQVFLKPGDSVTVEIDKIGMLETRIG